MDGTVMHKNNYMHTFLDLPEVSVDFVVLLLKSVPDDCMKETN